MSKVELKEIGLDIGLAFSKHFYKTDYLHYGYWPENLAVEPANVYQAQENYANYLLKNIPKEVKSILDVGCGSGKFAEKLIKNGYFVDCVSPSSNLNKHVKERLGNSVEIFETRFEDLLTRKSYDLILCSESFQYLLLEKAVSKIKKFCLEMKFISLSSTDNETTLNLDIKVKSFMLGWMIYYLSLAKEIAFV